jgi:hypothetical protein
MSSRKLEVAAFAASTNKTVGKRISRIYSWSGLLVVFEKSILILSNQNAPLNQRS